MPSRSPSSTQPQVLIVSCPTVHHVSTSAVSDGFLQSGSGPSGLFLALTLAKNGIPVRIIEKNIKYHEGQRGIGAQPRTLEIYNYLGALDDIVSEGQPMKPMAVYKPPEGTEILKYLTLMDTFPSTPSVPFVSTSYLLRLLL